MQEMERLVAMFQDAQLYAIQSDEDTFYVKVLPATLFNTEDEKYVDWEASLVKNMLQKFGVFVGFTSEGKLCDFDESKSIFSAKRRAQNKPQ